MQNFVSVRSYRSDREFYLGASMVSVGGRVFGADNCGPGSIFSSETPSPVDHIDSGITYLPINFLTARISEWVNLHRSKQECGIPREKGKSSRTYKLVSRMQQTSFSPTNDAASFQWREGR